LADEAGKLIDPLGLDGVVNWITTENIPELGLPCLNAL